MKRAYVGERVSGPEAAFYTLEYARADCAWSKKEYPN
jgi:hypothetical protein